MSQNPYRGWEYARIGDYHRNLDPNWSYTPTYLRKISFIRWFINSLPQEYKILDIGCGEGVLVEEFRQKGRNIEGLDLNYESNIVRRGDVCNLPYRNCSFDAILFLDTLEHLHYKDQPNSLAEIKRVLKPGGRLVISVPNLAHLNSRVRFFFGGKLDRTDSEIDHVGERPVAEYEQLLKKAGFSIVKRVGVTFTLPWVYRRLICRYPAKLRWLHNLMEPFAKALPFFAMINIFVCKKELEQSKYNQIAKRIKKHVEIQSRHPYIFSIYTHLTERERMLLFELASSLQPEATVVEIGSYLGASTCFLAGGVRSQTGKVYAVDTWTNIAMTEGAKDTFQEFLKNTEPLREWIVPLRGYSAEMASSFSEEIDLLFIDGDHSYEAVRLDLESWLPKVKNGGLVVFHDYSWAEGVRKAVRELVLPLQIDAGHRLDSIYFTRISHETGLKSKITRRATVVVPTYGRPQYLKDALISIQKQDLPPEEYEILVVDNSPQKDANPVVEAVRETGGPSISYIHEPNIGLHNARHRGAKEAQGEILVYVDDDVIVPPEWLRAILKPFEDPIVAIVGGKVLPKWEVEPPEWLSQFPPSHLSLLDLGEETLVLNWPKGAYGCNMAVRRSALYEVGGFNPDAMGDRRLIWLRGDGETGLHKKVFDGGYKVIYKPKAYLFHRIPPIRLQPAYFCWRAFIQGLSDSYTRVRAVNDTRFFTCKLMCHFTYCMLKACHCYLSILKTPRKRTLKKAYAFYWIGRGLHQLRVVLSPKLKNHVIKESYMESV